MCRMAVRLPEVWRAATSVLKPIRLLRAPAYPFYVGAGAQVTARLFHVGAVTG